MQGHVYKSTRESWVNSIFDLKCNMYNKNPVAL